MKRLHLGKIDWNLYLKVDERSEIRPVLVDDEEEVARLLKMEEDPLINRFVIGDKLEGKEDVVDFALARVGYAALAVVGKNGHVDDLEIGKLQGWISIYDDHPGRIKRMLRELMMPAADRYIEVGFAKYTDAKQGQMASALRQVISGLIAEHKTAGIDLVVTAYAEEGNEASERVLRASGFVEMGKTKYTLRAKKKDTVFVYKPATE